MPYNAALRPLTIQDNKPDTFGNIGVLITPGAGDQLDASGLYFKCFVVASAGDVTFTPLENADGANLTITGATAGLVLPGRIRRITAATAVIHGWSD